MADPQRHPPLIPVRGQARGVEHGQIDLRLAELLDLAREGEEGADRVNVPDDAGGAEELRRGGRLAGRGLGLEFGFRVHGE